MRLDEVGKRENAEPMKLFFILLIFLNACLVFADSPGRAQEKWFACGKDSDCIAVPSECSNFLKSVNRQYQKQYSSWAIEAAKVVKCARGISQETIPFCDHGLCWLASSKAKEIQR